ncbi:MAG: VWA domain-containing protein [Pyrinomonadaceae bacterium]|nr:VWA domain-containing protein [Pyrinomonadaceae bacterium]
MFSRRMLSVLTILTVICATAEPSHAQQGLPAPSPNSTKQDEQEPVKVFTEEVRVPVFAFNDYGWFDPTVEPDDILMLEDGVPQQIKSVRRIPASVLLLVDTGGDINPVKNVRTTREIALKLIAQLRPEDKISVLQANDRVELVQDWTADREAVQHTLRTKLLGSKRSRLSEAMITAAEQVQSQPMGIRHIVLITDGAGMPSGKTQEAEAAKQLMAVNATVHVISYTKLGLDAIKREQRVVRPREGSRVPEEVIRELPQGMQTVLRTPGGITIDLDRERRRRIKAYEDQMKKGESQLAALAGDTGGRVWLPESLKEIIDAGSEAARDIDAQYVVTYKPKRPLVSATRNEYRRIEIASRRVGLRLRARRGYVITASS